MRDILRMLVAVLLIVGISTLAGVRASRAEIRTSGSAEADERYLFGYLGQWPCRAPEGGPLGVAIDDSDQVFVLTGGGVFVYTTAGTLVNQWGREGEDPGQFGCPFGIMVGGDGLVYVTDGCRGRVERFTREGSLVDEWGSSGEGEHEFLYPAAIAMDDSGYVYVVDAWLTRVLKFTADGSYRSQWGVQGAGNGQFDWPTGIACDHHGRVLVADTNNQRIQVFTTSGELLAIWPVPGASLAVDAEDHLFVVDTYGAQVVELDSSGAELRRWGSPGRGDGQFQSASCAAVDHDRNVFVGDSYGRVQKFGMAVRWRVSVTPGPNGAIGPAPEMWVAEGMDQACSIVPDPGYRTAAVVVDGVPIGTPSSHLFTNVTADHTLEASFSPLFGWTHDPALNLPVCTAPTTEREPLVAPDGGRGAIIAWLHFEPGPRADARVQHVDANGLPRWSPEGNPVRATPNVQYPRKLLADGAGGAFVLVEDAVSSSSNDIDLFVQHLDASGMPQWGDSGVAICPGPANQGGADMVSDGSGGVIVAWSDFYDGPVDSVRLQHVDAAGVPRWGAGGVLAARQYGLRRPTLVSDGAHGAIVFWTDMRTYSHYQLFAQRIDDGGVPRWTDQGISVSDNSPSVQLHVAVSDGGGGAIVAWRSATTGSCYDYSCTSLKAQRLDPAGSRLWGPYGVLVCSTGGVMDVPAIVSDGGGGAIIAWDDYRDDGDVYASRIQASGVQPWPGGAVPVCTEPGRQYGTVLTSDGADGAIVSWVDSRRDAYDVYAQRVNWYGATWWKPGGVALCTAAYERSGLAIGSDGDGGAIVAWGDGRNGNSDIYAQQVDYAGRVGGRAPTDVAAPVTAALALERPKPNPLRGGPLVVRFSLASRSAASLELLDVAGRRVAAREVGSLGPGGHSIELANGGRLAPGLYFVRLLQEGHTLAARIALLH